MWRVTNGKWKLRDGGSKLKMERAAGRWRADDETEKVAKDIARNAEEKRKLSESAGMLKRDFGNSKGQIRD